MSSPDAHPADPVVVSAMHGWAGQSSDWMPWQVATAPLGWRWFCGERGYGALPPAPPRPQGPGRRLVIAHSLGPHLLPPSVLAEAGAVVLLASFGRFVPPGAEGRRLRVALAGMAEALERAAGPERARAMLRAFLAEAAAPAPAAGLPAGPADQPLSEPGRIRLLEDLQRLRSVAGLPEGFPASVPVLIVEAGDDRIVTPAARRLLRESLPRAEVLCLAGAGHALLQEPLIPRVIDWVSGHLPPGAPTLAPRPDQPGRTGG